MAGRTKVYSSTAVDLIVCAIPIKDGRAETFVKVTADEDDFVVVKGADGAVTRCATNNRLYHVEVTLNGSSEENAKLSALRAVDVGKTNGAGVGAFLLKDNNGQTLLSGSACWIVGFPDLEKGKEVKDVTWKFDVVSDAFKMIVGGN